MNIGGEIQTMIDGSHDTWKIKEIHDHEGKNGSKEKMKRMMIDEK